MRSASDRIVALAINSRSRLVAQAALGLIVVLSCSIIGLIAASIVSGSKNTTALTIWREHLTRCQSASEETYCYDRFRAVKGRVTDAEGGAIPSVTVRCSRVADLAGLTTVGKMSSDKWIVSIFATNQTDAEGRYSFPHLPVGAYTFFYAAPGWAPVVKDLIVVQDGLGSVLDVTLDRPRTLRVHPIASSIANSQPFAMPYYQYLETTLRPRHVAATFAWPRLRLIPHRWWPELPIAEIEVVSGAAKFVNLGGPLKKGLIVAEIEGEAWRVVGRYNLDEATEAVIGLSPPASSFDVDEAAAFEPWNSLSNPTFRSFYSVLSPVALLWSDPSGDSEFNSAMSDFLAKVRPANMGSMRGFGSQPFLPFIIESQEGLSRFGWTSEASEFAIPDLPAGAYRMRTYDLFGKTSFARGVLVAANKESNISDGLWDKLELEEPDAREIMGSVRWEDGSAVEKAVVIIQHTNNFRVFLRRVEADKNGFFRVQGVPGDEPYFAFAIPPSEATAVREFAYFWADANRRETWRDLTMHGHRIVGRLPDDSPKPYLQLFKISSKGDQLVTTFGADASGLFSIANVPHGRYRVQQMSGEGVAKARSLPIEIAEGRSEERVVWQ